MLRTPDEVCMVISDIKPGTKVQIVAARGVRTTDFDTTVIDVDENSLTVRIEPIYSEDKLVGFDIDDIVIGLYVASKEDSRVYQFPNVSIRSYKTADDIIYQEITCESNLGKITNRRGACRVWVGVAGDVIFGDSLKPHKVTIKDISATGIAFVCDNKTEVTMGMPITVLFSDDVTKQNFQLSATVVRHEDVEHARIVYGCRFRSESDIVSRYVNEKQRAKLKETRTIGVRSIRDEDGGVHWI